MKVRKGQLQMIFQEFPFLKEIVEKDLSQEVSAMENPEITFQVKRIDKNLLTTVPDEFYWSGSLVDVQSWMRVHFVLGDRIEYDAVKQSGEQGSNYAYARHTTWEGESVVSALARLGIKSLPFIVVTERDYDSTEGQEEVNTYTVTVYKAREDTPALIKKLIAREKFRAMVRVEKEVIGEE